MIARGRAGVIRHAIVPNTIIEKNPKIRSTNTAKILAERFVSTARKTKYERTISPPSAPGIKRLNVLLIIIKRKYCHRLNCLVLSEFKSCQRILINHNLKKAHIKTIITILHESLFNDDTRRFISTMEKTSIKQPIKASKRRMEIRIFFLECNFNNRSP